MIDSAKLAAALFFRSPDVFFSIEEVFNAVVAHMPKLICTQSLFAPKGGAGAKALLENFLWARSNASRVNHITGDIHYVALALPRNRTILTIHDLRALDGPPSLRRALIKLLWFTLPAHHVAWITVISEETRKELLRQVKIDPAKVVVIPDCVFPQFTYSPRPFNEAKPTLLQVGITDNKNILRLAQALNNITCRLIILGKPTDEQISCLNDNNIDFQWVAGLSSEEVVDLYRQCDIVTFVSTCEGFGLPIVEGNAVGRPVITSSLSSMPEVAGDAALLVDPYDVSAIRNAIERIIADASLRETLIAKGLKNVERFSAQKIAGMYAALYEKIYKLNAE